MQRSVFRNRVIQSHYYCAILAVCLNGASVPQTTNIYRLLKCMYLPKLSRKKMFMSRLIVDWQRMTLGLVHQLYTIFGR